MTVLFIEHDMDIVFKIAQRIHVLKYGAVLAQGTAEEIRRNQDVIDAYLGTDHHLAANAVRRCDGRAAPQDREAPTSSTARARSCSVSISRVEKGQTMALLGRNGAGKSTTFKMIAGIAPPRRGRVVLGGETGVGPAILSHRPRRHRLRAGGPAGLSRAYGRRQPRCRRKEGRARRRLLDARAHLRGLPDPRRHEVPAWPDACRAASSRC